MLSAGWLEGADMYPMDAALVRNKGSLFPQRNPELNQFNRFGLPGGRSGKLRFYPWSLAVRDWRYIHGKKLNRAFLHKGKIGNELDRLIKSSGKIAGTAQLLSAASVYKRYLEEFDAALADADATLALAPDTPIYLKRLADL